LYLIPTAAIAKNHGLGDFNNRNVSSHNSHVESEIKVWTEVVSSEDSLLGLWTTIFSPCPLLIFPLYLSLSKFPLLIKIPAILG
jgi:hypothetical protein